MARKAKASAAPSTAPVTMAGILVPLLDAASVPPATDDVAGAEDVVDVDDVAEDVVDADDAVDPDDSVDAVDVDDTEEVEEASISRFNPSGLPKTATRSPGL
jgi:hypothetical protein